MSARQIPRNSEYLILIRTGVITSLTPMRELSPRGGLFLSRCGHGRRRCLRELVGRPLRLHCRRYGGLGATIVHGDFFGALICEPSVVSPPVRQGMTCILSISTEGTTRRPVIILGPIALKIARNADGLAGMRPIYTAARLRDAVRCSARCCGAHRAAWC